MVVVTFRGHSDTNELIQLLATVITITATATAWLWRQAHPTKDWPLSLEQTANDLAEELRWQWERSAAEKKLIASAPTNSSSPPSGYRPSRLCTRRHWLRLKGRAPLSMVFDT
jgi:hypothetical protein